MKPILRHFPKQAVNRARAWLTAMRQFLRRQYEQLMCDDLFVRVISVLAGIVIGGIGVGMLVTGASQDSLVWLGWFNLLWWPIAALLTVWGALLLSRCAVPPGSRIAQLAERWLPDPAGPDDGAIAALVFVLPAALLTLLLRRIGIRGKTSPPGPAQTHARPPR